MLSARNIHNGKIDLADVDFVGKEEYFRIRKRCNPEHGDVLISCSGTIGRLATIPKDFHCVMVRSGALIKPNCLKTNGLYIQFYLQSIIGQNQIFSCINQGAQANLFLNQIKNLKIAFPPTKAEQIAIATALSNMDALIEAQEKLIAKKRLVKQGAMQELLKPKEGWSETLLKNAVEFLDSERRPIKSSDRNKMSGIYPYYGASGIIDYVNDYIYDDELILMGEDGENILSRNLPLVFKIAGKVWVNNHAHVLKPKDHFDIDFLTMYLESLDYSLLNSGTAQPKLNKRTCENVIVKHPIPKDQKEISKVLSDMESEIDKLEIQLTKYKQLKIGMMQDLLTGKKRLV